MLTSDLAITNASHFDYLVFTLSFYHLLSSFSLILLLLHLLQIRFRFSLTLLYLATFSSLLLIFSLFFFLPISSFYHLLLFTSSFLIIFFLHFPLFFSFFIPSVSTFFPHPPFFINLHSYLFFPACLSSSLFLSPSSTSLVITSLSLYPLLPYPFSFPSYSSLS